MRHYFLILVFFAALPVAAQPRLDLRLLRPNTPAYYYYQLYFTPYCGDTVLYDLQKSQLILEEQHGLIDTNDYIIDRIPSPDRNACYDVAMLIDNSSNISIEVLNRAIDAGRAFIDSMTLGCQSASIISFADRPTLHSFLGNDRESSRQAFDEMKPGGRRVLYDAIFAGMVELMTNGRQGHQLIFAVTTGPDNGSSISTEQLLKTARDNRTRVFVLGLGVSPADPDLAALCRETGGQYYSMPLADDLNRAFTDFEAFVQREYDEFRIVRRTRNPDMREVRIRLRLEACNDSVWAERTFRFDIEIVHVKPLPSTLQLGQCYPNPASPAQELHIPFHVDGAAAQRGVSLRVYDMLGRLVATLIDSRIEEGPHLARISPFALPPGTYLFRLATGNDIRGGMFVVR